MLSIVSRKNEPPPTRPSSVAPRPAATPPRESDRVASAVGNDADSALNPNGRKATRYPAAAVPAITGLRLSPCGIEAALLNISSTGLLAECGDRLQTGIRVVVNVDGTFQPAQIRGTVVRNSVASVTPGGGLRYHVAISFVHPIDVNRDATTSPQPPEPALAAPKIVQNRW